MRASRRIPRAALAAAIAALIGGAGCAGEAGNAGDRPPRNPAAFREGAPYRPAVDPSRFVETIDNPYLPLVPGTTFVYEGVSNGERERIVVEVTHDTRVVMGVTTTVVRDRVYADDELIEDTFDWYAQDADGNVWYFGEDTRELEGGEVVSTAGSWEAGVDGALPGIVMLADPRPGDTYRQEYYAGEAEDLARVLRLDGTAEVPYGRFEHVLVTEDWTPLEPDVAEHKSYARGIGLVMEVLVRGGEGEVRLVEVTPAPAGG